MKYSLLRKTFSSLLLGICISAAVFCGYAAESNAAALATAEGDSSGILQTGGLLEEDPDSGIMTLSLETDYVGASKALETGISSFQETINLSSYHIPVSDIANFYQDFVNNHPGYFYLDSSYRYSYSGDEVVSLLISYIEDAASLNTMVNTYDRKVSEIVAFADPSWSDLEKVLYINDYLAVNCEYDTSLQNHNAYNALVEQTAVCQGYALAFRELAEELGVTSGYVSSKSLNHAWNVAEINGKWYHVDTTWDDPIEDRYGRARHAYLLKSTSWFKSPSTQDKAHNAEDYVYYSSSVVSEPTSTDYDDYFWNTIDSPFSYYNGYWYANDAQSIKKYSGSSTGLQEYSTVKALTCKWSSWGSTSYYWTGAYSGCQIFGSKLYYAAPTAIQAIDLTTGQDTDSEVFVLSDQEKSEGYIYGFHITSDGVLEYGIAQSPNEAAARKEAALHTHSYGDWSVTKAPTCTEEGVKTQTCTECGKTISEAIAATGHTPGEAATCTAPQICTVCNIELAPAKGHSYDSGVITTQPTCAQEGIKTFTCTVCSDSYTEAVARTTSHSFGAWSVVKASTCTAAGTQSRTCSVCGITEEQSIAKTAHTPGKAATCTAPQTCTVCNIELAPAKGHSYNSGVVTTQPTCAQEGIKTFTCTVCSDSYTEAVARTTSHSFGAWSVVKASTCTAAGTQSRTCSVCGITEEKTIAKKAHTPGAAATCTTPQTCTVCKAVLVKATGHKAGAAATCTTAQKCTVCKAVLVKATGHKAGAAATCTTAQKCTVCKTVLKKATGHQHTKTVTQKATFVKKGSVKTVCKDCGKTVKTQTIAKVKCQKGKVYKVGNYKYKIVSAKTNGKGTVAFAGLANNVKKVNVVDTVTILGAKFKVVQIADKALKNKSAVTSVTIGKNVQTIGKEAFYGTKKLKTITIKSTRLTKVGANALKNTYAKAKIKVPKARLKKYKTLLNNKGQKKTVKIY